MRGKAVAGLASVVALAAGLAAAAQKAKESPLTSRFNRSARVWKLSARNSARFAVSRVRGIGSAEERRAQLTPNSEKQRNLPAADSSSESSM